LILIYFVLVLLGLVGAGGTAGALELDNITLAHATIQGGISLIVLFVGCMGLRSYEEDEYES
jgi:hypothetical protein